MKFSRNFNVAVLGAIVLLLISASSWADTRHLPEDLQKKLDALPDNVTRIEVLESEVKKAPDEPALHFALGNLYLDEGKSQPAAGEFEKTTQLDPGFLGGWVNLGNAQDDLGQLDEAQVSYREALKLEPTDEKALCNLGGAYFKKRQIDRALKTFQTALDHHPDSQLAHYNMAILFADSEIYREAQREWEKVVQTDPESDLGQRSAANIKIIEDLMKADMPNLPKGSAESTQ